MGLRKQAELRRSVVTGLDSAPEKQQLRVKTQRRREGNGKDGAGRAARAPSTCGLDHHPSEEVLVDLWHQRLRP